MATAINRNIRFSDLVQNENDPSVGYARESVNVTPPAANAKVPFGALAYRVKSLDADAAYTLVSNVNQLVVANEFVVVIGDCYGFQDEYAPNAVVAGEFNSVAFKRGPVILKEGRLFAANPILATAADKEAAKEVLKLQGIVVEKTLPYVSA